MACTVSPFFTDDELIENLRDFFEYEEMYTMDFRTVLNQFEDYGDVLRLRLRGRVFEVSKDTGVIVEVDDIGVVVF